MSPGVACHLEWRVTWSGVSPGVACHLEWRVTWSGVSPGVACHLEWRVTWSGVSPGEVLTLVELLLTGAGAESPGAGGAGAV